MMVPARIRRFLVPALAVVAATGACLLAVLAWTVNAPRSDAGGKTDVLLVLGPSTPARLSVAEDLMSRAEADVMVVSAHPSDTLWEVPKPCRGGMPYPVYCFDPSPATTQGEARSVAQLMREHGWSSVRALTYTPHVERARILLERCIAGEVKMQEVRQPYDRWYQLAYQGGGYAKTFARWGC